MDLCVCLCVALFVCLPVCAWVWVRVLEPVEVEGLRSLELQEVVSHLTGVLGTESLSSGRAVSSLNLTATLSSPMSGPPEAVLLPDPSAFLGG